MVACFTGLAGIENRGDLRASKSTVVDGRFVDEPIEGDVGWASDVPVLPDQEGDRTGVVGDGAADYDGGDENPVEVEILGRAVVGPRQEMPDVQRDRAWTCESLVAETVARVEPGLAVK